MAFHHHIWYEKPGYNPVSVNPGRGRRGSPVHRHGQATPKLPPVRRSRRPAAGSEGILTMRDKRSSLAGQRTSSWQRQAAAVQLRTRSWLSALISDRRHAALLCSVGRDCSLIRNEKGEWWEKDTSQSIPPVCGLIGRCP